MRFALLLVLMLASCQTHTATTLDITPIDSYSETQFVNAFLSESDCNGVQLEPHSSSKAVWHLDLLQCLSPAVVQAGQPTCTSALTKRPGSAVHSDLILQMAEPNAERLAKTVCRTLKGQGGSIR